MNTDTSLTFETLGLARPLLRALDARGYQHPSPIQAAAIPALLAGRDLIGCAQTGTGKTASFALPILQRLHAEGRRPRRPGAPRALVLAPTRELAIQVGENFHHYGRFTGLRHTVIFGGVGQNPQTRALRAGVDIVVATPGRLLDLHGQGFIHFDQVGIFVLDEADRMLDMGFAPDVRRVLDQLPRRRHSMLFSATMPPAIRSLAESFLTDPESVNVAPVSSTTDKIKQSVRHVAREDKTALLLHTLEEHAGARVLVFTRTKHGADRIARKLSHARHAAAAIHGNKSQSARQNALEAFRAGRTRVLVATDIAARGIDVRGIDLVINYELPNEPESYVHRIGRTARAGADGRAVSFCDATEVGHLRSIERLIRIDIPIEAGHPFAVEAPSRRESGSHVPARRGPTKRNRYSNTNRPRRRTGRRYAA
ncbi:MAG: DEAD/DEAH box helicase [Verrucomicrobia bacterium]|nr:MAG: DEAD/DEAH box helicase [Verrucomicrobiota bacterium]